MSAEDERGPIEQEFRNGINDWGTMPILMPDEPTRYSIISIGDGSTISHQFTDDYRGGEVDEISPIRRAGYVARLRTLADLLEANGEVRS